VESAKASQLPVTINIWMINMNRETKAQSQFTKHFMFSMVLFLVTLAVQTFSIELLELSTLMIILVTLLPMLPLIWSFVIYRKKYLALDEFMQRLTGESFLWVTGIMCFVTFGYGMLAMKLPMPELSFAYILPAVFAGHGIILNFFLLESRDE
jgi:uncharacterized membrane protein